MPGHELSISAQLGRKVENTRPLAVKRAGGWGWGRNEPFHITKAVRVKMGKALSQKIGVGTKMRSFLFSVWKSHCSSFKSSNTFLIWEAKQLN